ncbi:Exocyst complex component [Dirofilaria immitis]
MIAVANNLDICTESTEKLKQHIRLTMEADVSPSDLWNVDAPSSAQFSRSSSIMIVSRQALLDKIDQLKKRWNIGMQSAVGTLLDEVNEDIAPHLPEILTKRWLGGSSALETICMTIADYYSDHRHLRPHIRCALLMEIQYKIIGEYMIGIDNRRLSLANYDDRYGASKLLKRDGERIAQLFSKLLDGVDVTFTDLTVILAAMSDVLSLRDKSLLALETTTLVRKFPDMHVELLSALIQTREDMGRVEARAMAEDMIGHVKHHPKGDAVFSKLFQAYKTGPKRIFGLEDTMEHIFVKFI